MCSKKSLTFPEMKVFAVRIKNFRRDFSKSKLEKLKKFLKSLKSPRMSENDQAFQNER